jgi:hypothetical protein
MKHPPILVSPEQMHPSSPPEIPPRVVVLEKIYHQIPGEDPTLITSNFQYDVECDDQVFNRRHKITTDWILIETAWINQASMMIIQNLGPKRPNVQLGPDEMHELETRYMEVSLRGDNEIDLFIPVGQSIRIIPVYLNKLKIRCVRNDTTYEMSIFPK